MNTEPCPVKTYVYNGTRVERFVAWELADPDGIVVDSSDAHPDVHALIFAFPCGDEAAIGVVVDGPAGGNPWPEIRSMVDGHVCSRYRTDHG